MFDKLGFYQNKESGQILDVYDLEPVGVFCVWWKDVGYSVDTTDVWVNDEWLGHIQVELYIKMEYGSIDENEWDYLGESNE